MIIDDLLEGKMAKQFSYLARRFLQHPNTGIPLLSFVASSDDIVKWAGIPRKAYGFKEGTLTGFQRQLDDNRTKEMRDFIASEDNVSPTAVVIAFCEGTVSSRRVIDHEFLNEGDDPGELVWVDFELEDIPSTISEAVEKYLALVTPRLPAFQGSETNGVLVAEASEVADEEEFIVHDSRLIEFADDLRKVLSDIRQRGDDPDLYSEEEIKLLETLTELLKPAMLVDGQHRVYGSHTLEMDIPFPVCALPNVSWEEQVFQFVVVNQKTQPIPSSFLNAVLTTSLTQSEIENLTERLDAAHINIEEHQVMDRINNDPKSPFLGMIESKIAVEEGKLHYPGMRQLVNQFRRLTPDPRFANIAADLCVGSTVREKKRDWAGDKWFVYFCAFWGTVKEKFEEAQTGDHTLWTPDSQLLQIAVLQIIQDEFLSRSSYILEGWPADIEEFKERVKRWVKNVPRTFFAEKWTGVKLIPSPEGRERIRRTLRVQLENPDYEFQKSRLFR